MTVRYNSHLGCRIETTFTILTEGGTPTGKVHEQITMSCEDPPLTMDVETRAGQPVDPWARMLRR